MAKTDPSPSPGTDTETKSPARQGSGDGAPAEKKTSAKQLLLGMALLLGMVVGSASAAVVIASIALRPSDPQAAKPEEPTGQPATAESSDGQLEFPIEEALIVNVRQTNQRRYLSVKPVFAMVSEDALEAIKKKQGELQDLLIGVLKAKTLDELDDPEITRTLGREIQELANARLDLNGGIGRVYFTQLVVQ